jgi:hypothetical protein
MAMHRSCPRQKATTTDVTAVARAPTDARVPLPAVAVRVVTVVHRVPTPALPLVRLQQPPLAMARKAPP